MKFYLKILVTGYWFLVISFWIASPLFAAGEIESSQHVYYQVLESGKTRVKHEVRLINLTTNYYASEYSLFLGFLDIANIDAFDSQGPLQTDITPKDNGTDIHLVFNDQIVGKGKVLYFTIVYDTREIASKNGRIWEINIPKVKSTKDLSNYTISLSVPASFGKATYIKPLHESKADSVAPMLFTKEEVLKGISMAFGEYQIFDFTLSYHLRNSRLYPIITEIALPPQSAYQEVLLDRLEPAPLNVYRETDGNWLARYRLEASQKLDIKAYGKAKIVPFPQFSDSLQKDGLDVYLKPQKYWETLDPKILEKAKELKSARAIYDYIVNTLTYDYARIDKNLARAGAAGVLSEPSSAICTEFTDLFVALARAAGIPAREVDGFAYAKNTRLRPLSLVKDILHAWPEYYDKDKNTWIAIDPTWGNTSGIEYFEVFDFNHVAFVIKGHDSEYPSPAGSYKENGDIEKQDVEVVFAKDDSFSERRSIALTSDFGDKVLSGFPITGRILITNQGNKIIEKNELTFSASHMVPASQKLFVDSIPPFGKAIAPVSFKSPSYFDNFVAETKISFGNNEVVSKIHVTSPILVYLPWIGGGSGVAIALFLAYRAWYLYIQRPRQKSSLRGESKQPTFPRFKLPWSKKQS